MVLVSFLLQRRERGSAQLKEQESQLHRGIRDIRSLPTACVHDMRFGSETANLGEQSQT